MTEPRNLVLETAIADDPDDPQAYLVYADWLEEQGHPRAALIRAHVAEADPARPGKKRPAKDLFAKHPRILLGALAQFDARWLAWKYGFVRSARIHDRDVAALLAHPSARLLLELEVANTSTAVATILGAPPIALRSLALRHEAVAPPIEVDVLSRALPRLRSLAIHYGLLAGEVVLPPALRSLVLHHRGDEAIALRDLPSELAELVLRGRFAIDRLELPLTSLLLACPELPTIAAPNLAKLHVCLGAPRDLARLVATPLPALVELAIVGSTLDGVAWFEQLAAAPFAPQIRALSLESCALSPGIGEVLARDSAFPELAELTVRDTTLQGSEELDAIYEARPDLVIDGETAYDRYQRNYE